MIARLIKTPDREIHLLCPDGSIVIPTDDNIYALLTNFSNTELFFGDDGSWIDKKDEMDLVEGETLAIISDDNHLEIYDITPFMNVIVKPVITYLSVEEYAKKNNKSEEMIKVYLRKDRIPGAQKIGKSWIIPENAEYPVTPDRQRVVTWKVGRRKKEED